MQFPAQKPAFIQEWHAKEEMNNAYFVFFFWEAPQSDAANAQQDGLVWQSSAWRLSWREALHQPGWDKAAFPQGHSKVSVSAADSLLAIQWE